MPDDVNTQPWLIEIAIEPKSKVDQEKLDIALAKLAAEDPSFRVSTDHKSGQTILKGMDELHLDTKLDVLKRTYKVDTNMGAPDEFLPVSVQPGALNVGAQRDRRTSEFAGSSSSSSRTDRQRLPVRGQDRR